MKFKLLLLQVGLLLAITVRAWAVTGTTNTISGVTTNGGVNFLFPSSGTSNVLQIVNQGVLIDGTGFFANNVGDDFNKALIRDAGSVWSNTSVFYFAQEGSDNQLTVTNGGTLYSGGDSSIGFYGVGGGGNDNEILVTGSNSTFITFGATTVGQLGSARNVLTVTDGATASNGDLLWTLGHHNSIVVTNGGRFIVNGAGGIQLSSGGSTSQSNNLLKITGIGSTISSAGGLLVGAGAAGNQMIIENGGTLSSIGPSYIGNQATSSNNLVLITGAGSVWSNSAQIFVGNVGNNNQLVISNGGAVYGSQIRAGTSGGTGNSVVVLDGGLLETGFLLPEPGNSISNIGGIYQFTTPSPILAASGVSVTDGTISFRGINNAPTTPIANLSYLGNNTLRLNNATNASVTSYTFDSVANTSDPSNYQKLALINHSRWQSGSLTIGTGGAVSADAGSTLSLTGNFTIQRSTNPSGEFDLSAGTVQFTGGGIHTNAITGVDLGNNGTNGYANGFTAENFSYGRLTLGSTNDRVYFSSGNGAASNALYITWLDLAAFTNQYSSVSNMVTSLLFAPTSINIYYMISANEPNNAYLLDKVYQLDNGLGGPGGFLMPAVPEPSTLGLCALAALALMRKNRR